VYKVTHGDSRTKATPVPLSFINFTSSALTLILTSPTVKYQDNSATLTIGTFKMTETMSIFGFSLPTLGLLIGGLAVSFYIAYQKALPKPIPGIPYNKEVTSSILGDVVSMVKHVNKTKELLDWLVEHNVRHNSPIVQVFTRPLARPWVVVSDFREAQDVLLRRTKEFDRSQFLGDIFLGLIPGHHISMKSHDEEFKKHRRWLMDL